MEHLLYKIQLKLDSGDLSEYEIIEELNSEEVARLAPTLFYLMLIIVIGIPGNGLVCYIYRSTYSVRSSRWFIFFLAAVDLILCVFIVPAEMAAISFQYNFTSAFLCKLSTFLNLWSILSLGFTLVIVSIDRYRKVCKPLASQIDFRKARILSVVAVVLGFAISLPVVSVYGIYQFKFDIGPFNVTASECSFRQTASESSFAFYYVLFGMAMFTGALATICVLYVMIGKNIREHIHRANIKRNASLSASMAKRHQAISTVSIKLDLKSVRFLDDNLPKKGVSFQPTRESTSNEGDDNSMTTPPGEEDACDYERPVLPKLNNKPKRLEKTKSRRMRQAKARKATFSMFLISIAFVLSYLPFLCLLLAQSVIPDFTESLSDGGRAAHKFFLRSYFFNCAVNPFIYGIADSRFRDNCKHVIYNMHERVSSFIGCNRLFK